MTYFPPQSGPCVICGDTNYGLSCGGPTICPKCDCGHFDAATVEKQANVISVLRNNHKEAIEAKRRVEVRLRIALAALQQIYTVCNDNAADTCDARMALNFVREAACNGFEAATTRRTPAVAQAERS